MWGSHDEDAVAITGDLLENVYGLNFSDTIDVLSQLFPVSRQEEEAELKEIEDWYQSRPEECEQAFLLAHGVMERLRREMEEGTRPAS